MEDLKICIMGSGFMGREIGKVLVEKGYPVLLKTVTGSGVDQYMAESKKIITKLKRKGKISEEEYETRISALQSASEYDERFRDIDIVIESVIEDLELKKKIFAELEEHCSEKAILCTNTSSLLVSDIAASLKTPERVIGLHFFHPVKFIDLVEVVQGEKSSKAALGSAVALMEKIGKKPLKTRDAPCFYFNRVGLAMLNEIYFAFESGQFTVTDIEKMFTQSSFIVNPLNSTDITGIDIIRFSIAQLTARYSDRFSVPEILDVLIEKGRLGKKTNKGFYSYEEKNSGTVDQEIEEILHNFKTKNESSQKYPFTIDVALYCMMNETIHCLQEGIVTAEGVDRIADVYPAFKEGMFSYMDKLGLDTVHGRMLELEKQFGKRLKPASLLSELVAEGATGEAAGKGFYTY